MTFDELKLSAPLLDAVSALGFTEAMPVQAAVIPYLLEDNIDLIALAQTKQPLTVYPFWRSSVPNAISLKH